MTILKRIFQGASLVIAIFTLYLLVVAFIPGISVPAQPLKKRKKPAGAPAQGSAGSRQDANFTVNGISVSAWLYLPDNAPAPVPCIVMGHGLGGTRQTGLDAYAVRFQAAGFAVLVFDYRHFGSSAGEPRQLVWIPYQLEDWSAAIAYARSLKDVDPAKIALWGTSLSGGHVIVTAARDHQIACVSAQCPGLDGRASALMGYKREGLGYSLRMIMHGQRDLVRSWFGRSPHKIPIAGEPGTIALLTAPDAYEAFARLAPEDFVNEACARIIIRGDKYRPVDQAHQVRCPVLLQICDHDSLTPISAAEETVRRLGAYANVKHYGIGHFDIYFGDNFEKSVEDQLEFFKSHL